MAKRYSRMSEREKKAYRKRKKTLRRLQIYGEILVIALIVGFASSKVYTKVTGKSLEITASQESEQEASSSDDQAQLAVAAMDDSASTEEEGSSTLSDSTGLKPSSKTGVYNPDTTESDSEDAEKESEEESTEDAESVTGQGSYSAQETASTVAIDLGEVVSSYGILINADSGQVVATKNAYEKMYPASMTKIMTVLVAAENLSAEQLDQEVTLSTEAVSYSYNGGGSTSGFTEGETIKVRDLFYGTILPSGGDAAAQLAMVVSGDIDSFVALMNQKVEELGLSETTHFANPVGFYADDNYTTPYDMAMIMEAALDNSTCAEVLKTKIYDSTASDVNPEGITLSNWFLRRIEDKSFGGTIEAAKTGFVDQSGCCAASSEVSDSGTHYICVTGNSTSSWRCIYDHVAIYSTYAK